MRIPGGQPVYEITQRGGKQHLHAVWAGYTPLERLGDRWLPTAGEQRSAWTACMIAAAAVWKARPQTPVDRLEEQVNAAVRTLEETAEQVAAVGDDDHRVLKTIHEIDLDLDHFRRARRRPPRR